MGDDFLVGIGRTDDDLVLQLFDVSDTANPTLLHHFRFSSSGASKGVSAAEHDHHAFTFWPSRNLLAIPLTSLSDGSVPGNDQNLLQHIPADAANSLVVFQVNPASGFEAIGRVSHTDYGWNAWMQRSVFIESALESYLFAISTAGITVSSLDDIERPVARVPFVR